VNEQPDTSSATYSKNLLEFFRACKSRGPEIDPFLAFKILREAGLIRSERKGVELHNTSRCEELKGRLGEMVGAIIDAYRDQTRRSKSKRRKAS
jgi:hypothetical protein